MQDPLDDVGAPSPSTSETAAGEQPFLMTLVGRMVGPYRVEARLGGGAMASVYRAVDSRAGGTVALKVLLPDADATVRERFQQEARTLRGLRHPNIVRTLEVSDGTGPGINGSAAYIAMEMVDGESLADLLERVHTLNPFDSSALLAPIAQALAYAHSQGVVHRDVKPSNILLRRATQGEPGAVRLSMLDAPVVPLLSDFGIARALDAPDLTSAGRTIGTPAYMSPEQCAGQREIDGRSDIYSLGAVLYRCLVGRPPFLGTATQVLFAHAYDPVLIPDEVLRTLPPLIVEILRRSMAKERDDRYADPALMARDLEVSAGKPPTPATDLPAVRPDQETMTMASLPAAAGTTTTHVLVPGAAATSSAVVAAVPPAPPPVNLGARPTVAKAAPPPRMEPANMQRLPPATVAPKRPKYRGALVGTLLALALVTALGVAIAALLNVGPFSSGAAKPPETPVTTELAATALPVTSVAPAIAFTATVTPLAIVATSPTVENPPPVQPTPSATNQPMDTNVAASSATPAVPPAVIPGSPTPAEPPAGSPDASGAITPTATLGPTPVGDIALFWADAQAFYEERDWQSTYEWLTLVQRINADFERPKVEGMLFDATMQLAAQSSGRGDLEGALQWYERAATVRPDAPSLTMLERATNRLIEAESATERTTARKLLQIGHAAFAAQLMATGRDCDAAEQMATALAVQPESGLATAALQYSTRCAELTAAQETAAILDSLSGRLVYSTQVGDGHYRIYVANAGPDAESAYLIDHGRQPALSPGGDRVAFLSTRDDALGLAGFDLAAGLDPGARSILYTQSAGDSRDSPPTWNQEGSQLLFAGVDLNTGRSRIYALPAEGGAEPNFVVDGQSPAWNWALDRIAYNGADENGQSPGLWSMRPDGSDKSPLTDNGTDIRPAWTPDGGSLVFMSSGRSGNWDLFRLDLASGEVAQLTNNTAQDGLPSVSPDGEFVAFASDRGGVWNIWIAPIEGGDAMLLGPIQGTLTNWLEHSIQWTE
jgi:serine/threonine-protein kinase